MASVEHREREPLFQNVEDVYTALKEQLYVADRTIVTAVYLAIALEKPLLVEGVPGSGKTELGKVLSNILKTPLIRLQCYEGLEASSAIYEWNYLRQLLVIRMRENTEERDTLEKEIFGEKFLLRRPLLNAIMQESGRPVLLIDEVDRADEEFEGLLLEILGEFQITIPEIGTLRAKEPPIVILTSNRTRELSEALRRRCLYLYVDYPSVEKEMTIIQLKVPQTNQKLAKQICEFMKKARERDDITRKPGVSETLDWAEALAQIRAIELNPSVIQDTVSCVAKDPNDIKSLLAIRDISK